MTYLVKCCFFVFFGHPAPILRAIKVTLVIFDISKNRLNAFSSEKKRLLTIIIKKKTRFIGYRV